MLTSTTDPDDQLIRDVHAAAGAGLTIDLWPGSRIADFLDRNPEGQWLREQQFGNRAVRLSASQALDISARSLDNYLPLVERTDVVFRSLDARLAKFARELSGAGFLIGESGLGKSIALRRVADDWLKAGGVALILPHDIIEREHTLEHPAFPPIQIPIWV